MKKLFGEDIQVYYIVLVQLAMYDIEATETVHALN